MEVVKITTDGFKMIAAMKKIFRTIIALVATAAFASCAEEINNLVSDSGQNNAAGLVPMTFSSSADDSADSKTTYSAGKVCWEETDMISVFSIGETVTPSDFTVTERTDDNTGARFKGLADPNASVYYAVYPYSESNECDAEGNLTVSIPSTQNAVADGFMPGANTSVAYSVEGADENILQFRNISTLLSISFATDKDALLTKSVTIKAKKGENDFWGLSGECTVKFGEDGIPVVGEGDVKSVTLVAPKGGFVKGVSYYIPVYAVGSVDGLEVTYLAQDDNNYIKTNNASATVGRNMLFNIGSIPNPYPDYDMPDDFVIEIDFTKGWPFCTPFVSTHENEGDIYYYAYKIEEGKSRFLPIEINGPGGTDTYYMKSDGLYIAGSNNTLIYSPKFEDMYVTRVLVNKTKDGRVNLNSKTSISYSITSVDYMIYEDKTIATYNNGKTLIHDGSGDNASKGQGKSIKASKGEQYHVRARDAEVVLKKLAFTFSKTSPGLAPTTVSAE